MWHVMSIGALLASFVVAAAAQQSQPASRPQGEPPMLAIGAVAPDFELPGVDERTYRLADFAKSPILVIVFTCNHCPTAQAYEERIRKLVTDYGEKGVAVVAISPNDPKSLRLDELGYTDLSDTFEEMKIRARDADYNFPYLYDGDKQEVSRAYGPSATPTVFVFDRTRKLRYVGRIDDAPREERVRSHDVKAALDALLAGEKVPQEKTKSVGCSIKWADKRDSVREWLKKVEAEPVTLETAEEAGIRALVANQSDHLRLINVWATWCGPCVTEMPDLVITSRMYRHRGLELVTISGDYAVDKPRALAFLKKQHASGKNVLFDTDQDTFIDAIDPRWSGAMPYTMLIRPGGEIVYRRQGPIDVLELRREIVKQLGRRE